ncbi:MAG: hypothetical protein QXS54_09535 [Candidatus Methanomethylicaceae archaeon]
MKGINEPRKDKLEEILGYMDKLIVYSLSHGLNLHTAIGGKYGEVYVSLGLWKYKPNIGSNRGNVEGVSNPKSCDIVLDMTKKKLEVKWGMLHYDDDFAKRCDGIPYWGWGFSKGRQFLDRKFDYCILLAAKEGGAKPDHIFVLKCEEMTNQSMGGKRPSPVNKSSYYIEFSENRKFYYKREWYPKGPAPLEKELHKNMKEYEARWEELKEKGYLD